jgi:hypothetical protein
MARKLNMKFVQDMGKAGAGTFAAYLYEEIAGAAVVQATAQDGRFSPFDVLLQLAVGWGPFVVASMQGGGAFWNAAAGAVAYNRVDNIVVALGGKAVTPFGVIAPGETMAQAQARIGGNR